MGQDFDEGLLSAMAEAGGGNFQYVADPEGLRAFFAYELQELFSVAATGLAVTLVLAPGVDAELVSAFPFDARGNALEVAIGDLPAGDEIDLVFTVRRVAAMPGICCQSESPLAGRIRERTRVERSMPPLSPCGA